MASKFSVSAVATGEPEHAVPLKRARVGLYRPWTASVDEGWTRWVLENYDYAPISIYNADMWSAALKSRYDVIILPDLSSKQLMEGWSTGMVPGQYAGGIEKSGLANLQQFVEDGGTLIAINEAAAALVPLMSLPVKNVLDGLPDDKFFCEGALLRVQMQHADLPINYGVSESPVVMFERGPAFETLPGFKGAVLAKYAKEADPLESGLILHPELLKDKAAALELSYGKGRIFLYGFKPQHRGQAHGTYRYLFNALYIYEDASMPNDLAPVVPGKVDTATATATVIAKPKE